MDHVLFVSLVSVLIAASIIRCLIFMKHKAKLTHPGSHKEQVLRPGCTPSTDTKFGPFLPRNLS